MPPPAVSAYGALCRAELRRRSAVAYAVSAAMSVLLALLFSFRFDKFLHPLSLDFAWLVVCVVVVTTVSSITRRRLVSVRRNTRLSLFSSVRVVASWPAARMIAAHAVAGAVSVWSFVQFMGDGHVAALFKPVAMARRVSSTSPPVHFTLYQFDEGMLTVLSFGALFGATYAVIELVREHLVLSFPAAQQSVYFGVKSRLPSTLTRAVRFGLGAVALFWLAKPLFAPAFARAAVVIFGAVTHLPSEVADTPMPFSLLWSTRLFVSSAFCAALFGAHAAVMEVVMTRAMNISARMQAPAAALTAALTDPLPIVQWHAHLELLNAVRFEPKRRLELFDNFDAESGSWEACATTLLAGLAALTTAVNDARKGAQTPTGRAGATRTAAPTSTPARAPKTASAPVAAAPAIKPEQRFSLLDSLISVVVERVPIEASSSSTAAAKEEDALPALLRVAPPPTPSRASGAASGSAPSSVSASSSAPAAQSPLMRWLSRWPAFARALQPSTLTQTRALFSDLTLHLWRLQILSHMSAASRSEDPFGSAQKILPRVLAGMIDCLWAVESYVQTIPPHERRADGHQLLLRHPHALADGVQAGLYMITTTFYESLGELSLPPKYNARLQLFLDFAA